MNEILPPNRSQLFLRIRDVFILNLVSVERLHSGTELAKIVDIQYKLMCFPENGFVLI